MIDLSLRPAGINNYPLRGILIQGATPIVWVREIQRMGLSPEHITVYPVSGLAPNSIWGCLVECELGKNLPDFGRNTPCQLAHGLVFLPEKTDLYPGATPEETTKLLLGKKHLFHPELNMVELPAPIRWEEQIAPPAEKTVFIRRPEPPVFIPKKVKGFQVFSPPPAEVLQQLEEEHFPEREQLDDTPLTRLEKQKMAFYKALFSSEPPDSIKNSSWVKKMQTDLEDLIERNRSHVDRLLDMLKSNPAEGLKYAIPIDEKGTGRGSGPAEIGMVKRWSSFSPFSKQTPGGGKGGAALVGEDDLYRLKIQYYETAQKLMNKKDYQKASFIYLKLLKEYRLAAEALEKAAMWTEAASIYIQYLQDKQNAAGCYEKARMTREAIELYKELEHYEKAGDLCRSIGQEKEALDLYELVVWEYKETRQYLKAALLLKKKMDRLEDAQNLLFRGWLENRDPSNCLNNYFANIVDDGVFLDKLQRIYADHVDERNWAPFLQVLPHELKRRPELADAIREIAHEIIAEKRNSDPRVISELPHFQPGDPLVVRDLMRYKTKHRK